MRFRRPAQLSTQRPQRYLTDNHPPAFKTLIRRLLRHLSGVYTSFFRPAQTYLALTDIRNRWNHAPPGPIGLRFLATRLFVFTPFVFTSSYSYRLSLCVQPLSVLPQPSRIFWKVRILVFYGESVLFTPSPLRWPPWVPCHRVATQKP